MSFLLDAAALAWAAWIGLAVGIVSLLVSLIGLWLTFREARRARKAAELAQSDVMKVLALTRSRARLSALSSAASQVDTLSIRIETAALRGNREAFTAFRRAVKEALAVAILDQAIEPGQARPIDDALNEIAVLIDAKVELKVKAAKMLAALHIVSEFLVEYESRAKTEGLI